MKDHWFWVVIPVVLAIASFALDLPDKKWWPFSEPEPEQVAYGTLEVTYSKPATRHEIRFKGRMPGTPLLRIGGTCRGARLQVESVDSAGFTLVVLEAREPRFSIEWEAHSKQAWPFRIESKHMVELSQANREFSLP